MKIRQLTPDWLKGVAIVLMVYGHVNHVGALASPQREMVELIYTFHMPLFLLISGFFFKISVSSSYEAGLRLIKRLVLPYLVFISLYLIGLLLVHGSSIPTSNIPPSSLSDFFKIVFLRPVGAYWFIHSLIVIQLCFLLAVSLCSKFGLSNSIVVIAAITLLALMSELHMIAPRTALYYLLGVALGLYSETLPSSIKGGLALIGLIIIISWSSIFDFTFIQVAWCLSIMVFLAGLGRAIESSLFFSIISWFGRNSLVVLVFHSLFVVFMKPLLYLFLKIDPSGVMYSTFVVAIALLGSVFTALFLDRTRVTVYLFGIGSIYSPIRSPSLMH